MKPININNKTELRLARETQNNERRNLNYIEEEIIIYGNYEIVSKHNKVLNLKTPNTLVYENKSTLA